MYSSFFLILICSNLLARSEFIVDEPSTNIEEKFLTFNIETDVLPHRYYITIDLDAQLDFQYYNGTSRIRFLSRVDSNVLVFHFNKSALNELFAIRLTNVENLETIEFERAISFWRNHDALIGIKLGDANDLILHTNVSYDLYVEYKVKFSDEVTTGLFKTCVPFGDSNKSCYVTTHFESTNFRNAVPSFDVIGLKSRFNIEITHNRDLIAISNMPGNITTRYGQLVTTRFEETPVMSPYIVAFTVGKFKTIPVENQSNISINIYIHHAARSGSALLQNYSGQLLKSIENFLNSSYALPKLDLLVTRTTSKHLRGMENWGLITLDENSVLENTLIPRLIFDENALELYAHEIAHQFFGNLVTMRNITYLWLNEGFASYFSYHMLAELFPEDNFLERVFSLDTAITQYAEAALPITVLNDYQPYVLPNRKMYVYPKGCITVNSLVHVLGQQAFQTAMQMYIKKFAYDLVTPDDLIDVIQEVNEIHHTIPNEINIREFINSWLNQNRFPILNVTRNYTTGDVVLNQTAFKIHSSEPDQTWWIPFNYATKSKPNFWNTLPDGWLRNSSMTLPLNLSADDWIIFNKKQSGNYVVQYDDENWRLITAAMIGDDFEIIPPIERARTISDAHFLSHIAKKTDTTKFYKLLPVIQKDRSQVTWSVINRILKIYQTNAMTRHMHLNYLNYFKPAYDHLGFELLVDDSRQRKLTKIMVTYWACFFQYDKCVSDMNKKSEEYLKSIEANAPLMLDESIVKNLIQFGFLRDAAYEEISVHVHNSSNELLKEMFYSEPNGHVTRPLFQLHYMLTMYNLTMSMAHKKPKLIIDPLYLNKLNEFEMFNLCLSSNCYNFTENSRTIEERNQLIDTLVGHVIRKIERNEDAVYKINRLFKDVEVAYNVQFNYKLKDESDLKLLV